MKRRAFLLGLLAAPAAPLLAKIPAPATIAAAGSRVADAMTEALLAAAERAVNPPMLVDANGNITALYVNQYRDEFVAQLEHHQSLLREVMGRAVR